MSTRTIVEINHDYLNNLTDAQLMSYLRQFLSSAAPLDEWNRTGIRLLAQRHHSEKITIKVE